MVKIMDIQAIITNLIETLSDFGLKILAVRPYCNNDHYWQVYFDTNRLIREAFGEAGYPNPEQYYAIRQN